MRETYAGLPPIRVGPRNGVLQVLVDQWDDCDDNTSSSHGSDVEIPLRWPIREHGSCTMRSGVAENNE
ncbi:hypothetical protein M405DRAFT_233543 [Rhizopogon salebrosus TDB-379]|nr:hypothetical protein M405DRAFT_233543 [Rhizopogon salebrosus TDB-379]